MWGFKSHNDDWVTLIWVPKDIANMWPISGSDRKTYQVCVPIHQFDWPYSEIRCSKIPIFPMIFRHSHSIAMDVTCGGPYNFSVPAGEDQYFVTNFAVLGVLRCDWEVWGKKQKRRVLVQPTPSELFSRMFFADDLSLIFSPKFS